jgi:hypothetical protein
VIELVKSLMVIVLFASSIGQLGRLHDLARKEAIHSPHGWKTYSFFNTGKHGNLPRLSIN